MLIEKPTNAVDFSLVTYFPVVLIVHFFYVCVVHVLVLECAYRHVGAHACV